VTSSAAAGRAQLAEQLFQPALLVAWQQQRREHPLLCVRPCPCVAVPTCRPLPDIRGTPSDFHECVQFVHECVRAGDVRRLIASETFARKRPQPLSTSLVISSASSQQHEDVQDGTGGLAKPQGEHTRTNANKLTGILCVRGAALKCGMNQYVWCVRPRGGCFCKGRSQQCIRS
jgi:hypothetical protein